MKTTVIIAVVTLIVGLGVGYLVGGSKTHGQTATTDITPESHTLPDGSTMGTSDMEASMKAELSEKKGESFDQEFISQMILHHQDAIETAKLALTKSKREEIINLSNAVIEVQSREIEEMKSWQRQWFGL
jgi:uncharacterized protein (DUF305 family)